MNPIAKKVQKKYLDYIIGLKNEHIKEIYDTFITFQDFESETSNSSIYNFLYNHSQEEFKKGYDYPEWQKRLEVIQQRARSQTGMTLKDQYDISIFKYKFPSIDDVTIPQCKFDLNMTEEEKLEKRRKKIEFEERILSYQKPNILESGEGRAIIVNLPEDEDEEQFKELEFKFRSQNSQKLESFQSILNEYYYNTNVNLNNQSEYDEQNKIRVIDEERNNEIYFFEKLRFKEDNLVNTIFENQIIQRANLLTPSRYMKVYSSLIAIMKFLFLIKKKIEKNRLNQNKQATYSLRKKKTKWQKVKGTHLISFSQVNTFVNSHFGPFQMSNFIQRFNDKKKERELRLREKKTEEMRKTMKEFLNKKEEKDFEFEESDEMIIESNKPKGIEFAKNYLISDNTGKICTYKPRKKLNYINGLKQLISEEGNKNRLNV